MSAPVKEARGPLAFKVDGGEMAALVTGRLGLQCNSFSPFAGEEIPHRVDGLSTAAGELAGDPLFQAAAAILAQPRLRIVYRKGGGSVTAGETFTVYGRPNGGKHSLVSLHSGKDNSHLILYFENTEVYLDWWAETFAGKVYDPAANLIAPSLSLESLVCLFHAIDSYRRAYMENMLSYAPGGKLFIRAAHFLATMRQSLQSGDTRWLLPSLFSLTPGLGGLTLNLLPEHINVAEELGFLDLSDNPGTGEEIYLFGDPGRTMGMEFCVTWLSSMGWEASVMTPAGGRVCSRVFLAPTAFANHLFSFEQNDRGTFNFVHHALTFNAFKLALAGWFQSISGLAGDLPHPSPSSHPKPPVPPAPPTPPGGGLEQCAGCGEKNPPGSRFCQGCGKPLVMAKPLPPRAACPRCGKAIKPGSVFCGGCGQTIKR